MNPSPSTYTPQPGTIPARVLAHFRGLASGCELATGVLADELGLDSGSLTACLSMPRKHGALVCENRGGLNYWKLGVGRVAHVVGEAEAEPDDEAPVQRVVKASRHDGAALLDIPRFPGVVVQSAPAKAEAAAHSVPRGAPRGATGPHALKPLDWLAPPAAFEDAPPQKPQGRDSQQVLKAEAPGPDATACETPANTSPGGGPMGAGQPAAAGPAGGMCAPAAPVCGSSTPATLSPPAPMRCAVWSDGTFAIERGGHTQTYTPEETRALVRYLERMVVEEATES